MNIQRALQWSEGSAKPVREVRKESERKGGRERDSESRLGGGRDLQSSQTIFLREKSAMNTDCVI